MKVNLINLQTNQTKTVKAGFSWTTFVKSIDEMLVHDLATKQAVISDYSKDKLVSVIDALKTMSTDVVQVVVMIKGAFK